MTSTQLDRQALVDSDRHWAEDYKKLVLFGGDEPRWGFVFGRFNCELCHRHHDFTRTYYSYARCGRCALSEGVRGGCHTDATQYGRAKEAEFSNDKPAFMRARRNIRRRIQRAIAKLDATEAVA